MSQAGWKTNQAGPLGGTGSTFQDTTADAPIAFKRNYAWDEGEFVAGTSLYGRQYGALSTPDVSTLDSIPLYAAGTGPVDNRVQGSLENPRHIKDQATSDLGQPSASQTKNVKVVSKGDLKYPDRMTAGQNINTIDIPSGGSAKNHSSDHSADQQQFSVNSV